MAFDGSVVAALTDELNHTILGGRISKITEPEKDELMLTVKGDFGQKRLLISVNPSLPLLYLTEENKQAPITAPAFCMLLRKHIQNGRIIKISQPSLERIVDLEIEHYDEMGDLRTKILTVELMGKHSNIIFRDGVKILDSIRHVSALVSSVREVLPGREYFIPFSGDKLDPFTVSAAPFMSRVCSGSLSLAKSLYTQVTGISPIYAEEIAFRAGLDSDRPASSLTDDEKYNVFRTFQTAVKQIEEADFQPNIVYKDGIPFAFCPFRYEIYKDMETVGYPGISSVLFDYYAKRQSYTNTRQKTADLRQIVTTHLNKDYKKYDLQLRQLKDTSKKDKFRKYGELLTAYGYSAEPKATSFRTVDFYTGEEVTIPLDPTLSAIDNGKRYFDKYSKMKRTAEALSKVLEETKEEIAHLESIAASLETARNEADIADIKNEMTEYGYIRRKAQTGRKGASRNARSTPLHYVSSDGFEIYVGKNNYQNDYITFKLADGGDWWFHAKKFPGSHVIVKSAGAELPDRTFEEAASLAAHYSKAEGADKVEIDYVQRKYVKKPNGAKPGFVIYHTNYSMTAPTDISHIKEV